VAASDARRAAEVLAAADLRGIDSGVARLHAYHEMMTLAASTLAEPARDPMTRRRPPSTATMAWAWWSPRQANEICMDKAEAVAAAGSACAIPTTMASRLYAMQGLERNLINCGDDQRHKLVARCWGAERHARHQSHRDRLSGKEEPAIVIDMATCAAAFASWRSLAATASRSRTAGPSTSTARTPDDPEEMIDGGAILPLGSDRPRGGHKGYALAMMVDVLSGALSGANWGPFTPPFALRQEIPRPSVGKGIGHFFGSMRIDGFIEPDEFRRQIDDMVRTLRASRPAPAPAAR